MPVDRLGLWNPPTTVHPSQLHTPLSPGYTYRDPIPTVTTQTPGELLDEYYIDRRNHPDWTDPNGVLSKQLEVCINHPHNAAGSIGSAGLVGEWPRPHGLAAEPVPVCWDLGGPQLEIEFRNLNPECPSAGIPLADFYVPYPDALAGAGDIIFNGSRRADMKLVIAWPGYRPQWLTIGTAASDGRHLSRFELGQRITTAYAHFFWKVESDRILPSEVGFYNIALHQGVNARSDSLGVQLLQLHLVRLRGTIGGTWAADVDIV